MTTSPRPIPASTSTSYAADLDQERAFIDELYRRLDELTEEKRVQLDRIQRGGAIGSMQNQSERDSFATLYQDRIAQLQSVDDRLVFGRLDTDEDDIRHIGRIGLTDDDQHRLLIDWRAPESAAFYQATAHRPMGIARRRQIHMYHRDVVSFEDEVFSENLKAAQHPADDAEETGVSSALLRAVTAPRTGQMGDIVATIQSEQDSIIRAPLPGVLVVQGGPGTGKTAVALHRAAYLLYTYRQRLSKTGVLLVGPSETFMNYIDQVLPSLGETGVVMSSLAKLYPGVNAAADPDRTAADIKGRATMAQVIANAVALRQRSIPQVRFVRVEGTPLRVRPKQIRDAIAKARASGLPHNEAREVFVKTMVKKLTDQMRDILDKASQSPDGEGKNEADRSYIPQEIRQAPEVRTLLNMCWMPLRPEDLIDQLFSRPQYLVDAAPDLSSAEILALLREPGEPFTEADVPLLDEAAELLGDFSQAVANTSAAKAQRERDLHNAEVALENVHQTLEDIGADGIITAQQLADAQAAPTQARSTADRAQADRTWTYGHIIVDEAQELSHMQWRMLFRRCPMRSFTIVGDIAQSSSATQPSWETNLAPFVDDRWTLAELTVNYRTPQRITTWAADVAQAAGREVSQPQALREGDYEPTLITTSSQQLTAELLENIEAQVELLPDGLIGVIVPASHLDQVRTAVAEQFPDRIWSGTGLRQDKNLAVVNPAHSKGLEYDGVIIVEPQLLVAEADGGVGDLYVAMTRATQTLTVLTTAEATDLPEGLTRN